MSASRDTTNPDHNEDADHDAIQQAYAATLLKGFDLAIGDGSAAAFHRALEVFAHAALLDASRPESYLGMGLCYAYLGDDGRALRHYDLCLEHGFGVGAFANLRYEHDDDDGQSQTYEIDLDAVLGWRAACHLNQGKAEAAARELGRVSDSPANELRAGLAVLRGSICLDRGDITGAQNQLGEALAWDSEEPDAHFLRGQLHERQGHGSAAIRAYARAIKLDPSAPEFRIARARMLVSIGNQEQAGRDLQAAERLLAELLPQPEKLAQIAALRGPPHGSQ